MTGSTEISNIARLTAKTLRMCLAIVLLSIPMTISGMAQSRLAGHVSDSNNEPLVGVSVVLSGTTVGAVTDSDGNFQISASIPCTLVISCIGFQTQEIKVTSPTTNLSIILQEDKDLLDEVVVVGYGTQTKKSITGATVHVQGDDVAKLNTVNALGALQSQTPGLSITQNSGMPGQGYKVVIRGIGTTGNSTPLYIIDGVVGGSIDNLNPADIESVDVLKDAATAAIYGSRAANGVILVTTKQGRAGKIEITYDGYYGIQNVYKMLDLLNAQEYAMIMSESRMMDGLPDYDYASLVPNWESIADGSWKGTDWLDLIREKNAPITNHTVNVTGGTEQSVYSLGFGYTHQIGILGKPVAPNYTRYSGRLNTEHTLIRKGDLEILKLGENLQYAYTENKGIQIWDIYSNDIRNMLTKEPFQANKDADGNYTYAIPWEIRWANPIAYMDYTNRGNKSINHNLQGNVYMILQPIKGLKYRSSFGFTFSSSSDRSFTPEYKLSSNQFNDNNSVYQAISHGGSILWENTVTYDFNIKEHGFNVMLGQSIEKDGLGVGMDGSNINSIFSDFKHAYLNNTPIITTRTTLHGYPWDKQQIASFFGRVNYNYANKYLATVVLRADGSSKFAKGHRWGYFPSFSLGWVISDENFMKSTSDWLNFLKIRAGWGQNGNQDIPGFQYLSTISFSGADYVFGPDKSSITNGAYSDIMANEDVSWETSEQIDVGFDASFLDSRLGLSFDVYNKKTKDWLVDAPILATSGTGAPYINGGDVENKGAEVQITWNDKIGAFTYSLSFNLAYNKNEVTKIANGEGIIHGESNVLCNQTSEMYRAQVGYPIGYFYGYKTAGIFQTQEEIDNYKGAKLPNTKPGDVIWVDRNGDGSINEDDRGKLGDPHPDFTSGFGFNASYKGFDLNITLSGVFGNQIMRSYRMFVDYPNQNYTTEIFKRWHGPGTSNKLPRLSSAGSTNWQYVSDLYMEDGDYVRIQNITLGYDFKNLFKSWDFVKSLRLYITAQNLFTFTGYKGMDPEVGYGASVDWVSGIDLGYYPSPRTYLVGLGIKF
jgi:TonB-linked SusC/RagA family outer membrane protein